MLAESILIFGGGELQLSIIQRVKKKGYRAIVIDPDPNAEGKDEADVFRVIDGQDFEATMQIATENKIKGLVTAATDKPILLMCRIAKELGLPFPSTESCEIVLNKGKFKKFLLENNFQCAKGDVYNVVSAVNPDELKYPLIVKPTMNSGSRGVIKCDNYDILQDAIKETLTHCSNGYFIIEEYISGDEISVEAVVQNDVLHVLQITDKIVTPAPYNVELGHIQPSKYSYLKEKIAELLQSVVLKIGLNNCAIHPEIKIVDGELVIIEIGPRLGGDFITSHLVPLSTDVNIEDLVIDISIGKQVCYDFSPNIAMISYHDFQVDSVVVREVDRSILYKKFSNLHWFRFDLKVGDRIPQITNSLDRYGYCILTARDEKKLLKINKKVKKYLFNTLFDIEEG